MWTQLRDLWTDEAGMTTVEYAVLLALVAVVSIAGFRKLAASEKTSLTQFTNYYSHPVN